MSSGVEAAVPKRDQQVGALVVTDGMVDDRLIGIVTDRDMVLKATALGGIIARYPRG